jgi:hypothetical protein
MNVRNTIAAINQMQADGVIDRYAIGGAVGATFYLEPMATLDVDVFITIQPEAGSLIASPQRIFDLTKILQSKRGFRQRLAARPIEEKLAMLDALREQALTVRSARVKSQTGLLYEQPPTYRTRGKKTK